MKTRIIRIQEDLMRDEKEAAALNRSRTLQKKQFLINVMASPGAGKTSLILSLMNEMKNRYAFSVIEGDVDSTVDADKINNEGFKAVQIQTGGFCHLNPFMIEKGLNSLDEVSMENSSGRAPAEEIIFIENIGNLICPVSHDLGELVKLVILSVPEGDDKPWKYPAIFKAADLIVLNKADYLALEDFNREEFEKQVEVLNPGVKIFPVSCRTKEGIPPLAEYLEKFCREKAARLGL